VALRRHFFRQSESNRVSARIQVIITLLTEEKTMGPDTLKHLFGLMIPIIAICIPIVAIVAGIRMKMAREQLMHETVRQLAERGQPIPPELLNAQLREAKPGGWTPAANLRGGAINTAVGLGLILMFSVMQPGSWLWSIGCIPLFIGIALLLLWRMERDKA
jgi:hypothetical protein